MQKCSWINRSSTVLPFLCALNLILNLNLIKIRIYVYTSIALPVFFSLLSGKWKIFLLYIVTRGERSSIDWTLSQMHALLYFYLHYYLYENLPFICLNFRIMENISIHFYFISRFTHCSASSPMTVSPSYRFFSEQFSCHKGFSINRATGKKKAKQFLTLIHSKHIWELLVIFPGAFFVIFLTYCINMWLTSHRMCDRCFTAIYRIQLHEETKLKGFFQLWLYVLIYYASQSKVGSKQI